jgi:hypothetical protein
MWVKWLLAPGFLLLAFVPQPSLAQGGWQPFTYDQRAFAAQPGNVLPMTDLRQAGYYLIEAGPSGPMGLTAPTRIKSYGPYPIRLGHKYIAIFRGDALEWKEDDPRLASHTITGDVARIYTRNDASDGQFYGIRAVLTAAAPDALLGAWTWSAPGWTVRFLPDGKADSFSANDRNTGTWRLVGASPRVYEIRWVKGATIDTLTLSADGQRLDGTNQHKARVSATRIH